MDVSFHDSMQILLFNRLIVMPESDLSKEGIREKIKVCIRLMSEMIDITSPEH